MMVAVWVYSASRLQQMALANLVSSLGYRAQTSRDDAELALFDLSQERLPHPAPPDLPTLALVGALETRLIQLLQQGYRGYLRTSQGKDVLERALAALFCGEMWAERHILAQLLVAQEVRHELTDRERQVLTLLDLGLPNKGIAKRLGIAESTVKVHVSALLVKHGVKRRLELLVQRRRPQPDPAPLRL